MQKSKFLNIFKGKINNRKVKQVYKRFEKSLDDIDKFVVAVSGGPDSMALAFLSKIYSLQKKAIVRFFIVDHKIRPESTKEARTVKKILKQNLIDAEILTWKRNKSSKISQAVARKKRYELLFKECEKLEINNLLTGHQQDDIFENFFIRILRGSGLKGLISLDRQSKINGKNLFRPLWNEKKEDLEFISKHIFNFYVNDPSNDNEKYQRIRVRKFINQLQENGLDKKKFFKTIQNLRYSNEVVKFFVKENLKKNTCFSSKNKNIIISENFFHQPDEVIFRSLSDVLQIVGKKHTPARGKKIEKIIGQIGNNRFFRATLAGCIIEKVSQTVIISKEL
tara:strand:- start:618 stop:1628 length:1011 start_codon:yes stop_codon:yes gene_type:complete